MLLKILYPLFCLIVLCLSPIFIWIALVQIIIDRRIWHYQKLYRKKQLTNHIYARKCEVKEITDKKVIRKFLRQNHLFGVFINLFITTKKSKAVGLYYNDKLVYITCYNKKKDYTDCYAMCSRTDTTVVGGASKCLKQLDGTITTISFKQSTLYSTLGFEEDGCCNLLEMMFNVHSKSGMFRYWKRG